jgi:raffinose/stachyose/melibiose transport system substrate-binding protein
MKRNWKSAAAVGLSAALCVSLCACGGTAASSSTASDAGTAEQSTNTAAASSDGSKTITFWNVGTEGADLKTYQLAIDAFQKNTKSGYTVENVPTQNDKYKEKLVIAMSSGECPDMYTSWSGGPMDEYIDSGYAQPLDDLYEKYGLKDKYMDAAIQQASYNGKIYAVPVKNISVAGIYYNKDLFEKYGVAVPTKLSELEAACDTFLANGVTPFTLANGPKWTGSMYFQCLVARKAGLEPFQKAAAGEGSFNDDSFTYAGEKIQDWVNKGYFPDGFNSMSEDDGQAKQLFYQETAAMYLTGSWNTATFKTDSDDAGNDFYSKVGWFSFPAIDDSTADPSIMCGTVGDQFISFNCTGEKLDAAFELASYLSSDDVVDYMVSAGQIPPIKGVDSKITDPVSQSILQAANNASGVQLWYDQYLAPAVATAHLDGNQEVFGLTKTPAEANQMMQDAEDEYLASKKS